MNSFRTALVLYETAYEKYVARLERNGYKEKSSTRSFLFETQAETEICVILCCALLGLKENIAS